MHVKAKQMAMAGVMSAITVLLVYFGTIVESNTLFFLAAASFTIGVAVREWGLWMGIAFWSASVLLNLLLVPNKFYGMTFAGMGFYIWLSECIWKRFVDRKVKLWMMKYIVFNLLYLPVLIFMPSLLFTRKMTKGLLVLFVLLGQVGLFVFEAAYEYFQRRIWGRLRIRLLGGNGKGYGC